MQSKVVLNHTSLQKLAKYRKDVKEDYGWLTGRQAEVQYVFSFRIFNSRVLLLRDRTNINEMN